MHLKFSNAGFSSCLHGFCEGLDHVKPIYPFSPFATQLELVVLHAAIPMNSAPY